MYVHEHSSLCRLDESVSQTGSEAKLREYAKTAASYIHQLESKLATYQAINDVTGSCGHTDRLSEEILKMTEAGQEGWTNEEWEEWAEWDRLEDEYLNARQADDSYDEAPQESFVHPASRPSNSAAPAVPSAPAAPALTDGKVNSTTHRAQYMRLASHLIYFES